MKLRESIDTTVAIQTIAIIAMIALIVDVKTIVRGFEAFHAPPQGLYKK